MEVRSLSQFMGKRSELRNLSLIQKNPYKILNEKCIYERDGGPLQIAKEFFYFSFKIFTD